MVPDAKRSASVHDFMLLSSIRFQWYLRHHLYEDIPKATQLPLISHFRCPESEHVTPPLFTLCAVMFRLLIIYNPAGCKILTLKHQQQLGNTITWGLNETCLTHTPCMVTDSHTGRCDTTEPEKKKRSKMVFLYFRRDLSPSVNDL